MTIYKKDDMMKQFGSTIKMVFLAGITVMLIFGCVSSKSGDVYSQGRGGIPDTFKHGLLPGYFL